MFRALVKIWVLSVQKKAGCLRLSRTGVTSLSEHLEGIWQAEKLLPGKFILKHPKLSWQISRIYCLAQLQQSLPQERASGS